MSIIDNAVRLDVEAIFSLTNCSPQDVIKKLEKAVNVLIEESSEASAEGDLQKVHTLHTLYTYHAM